MANDRLYGATPTEWESAVNSPLADWIVPIVSNPNLPASPKSGLCGSSRGKVPSVKNKAGEVTGIKGWSTKGPNKPAALKAWMGDQDYGFGVRCGRNGLIAVDCDCDDQTISSNVRELLFSVIHAAPPLRRRGNARWACLLRLKSGESLNKAVCPLIGGYKLEILGNGQQLACAGTHPSGARYEWEGGAVGDVIEVEDTDFEAFRASIAAVYNPWVSALTKDRKRGETFGAADTLADWLREAGKVHGEGREGELYIDCPWQDTHTDRGGATSTVYFPIGSNGFEAGGFKCLHAHCAGRGMADFLTACKADGYRETSPSDYPDLVHGEIPETRTNAKTTLQALMEFRNEKTGKIDPCLQALELAMSDPVFCGYEIAFDTFAAGEMVRQPEGEWMAYDDTFATTMRTVLESRGFRTPKKQDVIDKIKEIAKSNTFDSLADYLAANIPQWDGERRVAGFFASYCGADATPWAESVSLYLFTALWARASSPHGCKADIAPVLIGKQGTGKSTLARILALNEDWCADVDFTEKDADIAREMRQKIVMEIPELGGMSKREQNGVKAFMTRKKDNWVPKFVEAARTAARRCVFIVTTNDREFLTDETGNRRWAPVEVGEIDNDAVQRDLLQLWAEARELYTQNGIMFGAVERMQPEINRQYTAIDPWADTIAAWLAECPDEVLTTKNIVEHALRLNYSYMKKRDANALAKVMRALGYERKFRRTDGKLDRVWALIDT